MHNIKKIIACPNKWQIIYDSKLWSFKNFDSLIEYSFDCCINKLLYSIFFRLFSHNSNNFVIISLFIKIGNIILSSLVFISLSKYSLSSSMISFLFFRDFSSSYSSLSSSSSSSFSTYLSSSSGSFFKYSSFSFSSKN